MEVYKLVSIVILISNNLLKFIDIYREASEN